MRHPQIPITNVGAVPHTSRPSSPTSREFIFRSLHVLTVCNLSETEYEHIIMSVPAEAVSTASGKTMNSEPKSAAKIRKRAPKACLGCRARKVRCDVSQRGRPCMNCYLDHETCVVTSRASRLRRPPRDGSEAAEASYPPYSAGECNNGMSAEDVLMSRMNGEPVSQGQGDRTGDAQIREASYLTADNGETAEDIARPQQCEARASTGRHAHRRHGSMLDSNDTASVSSNYPDPIMSSDAPLWGGEKRIALNSDITYSYYPFLSISNLPNIMPQDVNYLESQGCLRVPTREILDDFVQQYFLHVHPLLPLINEGEFWEMYCHAGLSSPSGNMSLVVFQAMLFSSCSFVSKSNIKALGFPSIRAARATLYRRAKLLFDFDTDNSLIHLAQTALLLTYWSPNWSHAMKKPNTAWLGIAIQNAKSSEAHLYSAMPNFSPALEPEQHKKQNVLKRLWWCCVIRDRILSLGMRRSLQISRAHFNLGSGNGLGYADLADEVERSRVYRSETKRCLIEIFVQLGELCSVLTDLLTLVFPLDDAPGWDKRPSCGGAARAKESKIALKRWHHGATLRFPMFGGASVPRVRNSFSKQSQHDSVILYTNLMYMYYHSARVALCHHEVLQLAVASTSPNMNSNIREISNIYENRHELQDAASGVTECLKELIQLRLARWLPISAVASTALPLVLHIIDMKLSSHNKQNSSSAGPTSKAVAKQHRLDILIEAMKTYQPQYDGVDYVSETIRHIINLAQLDPPADSTTNPASLLSTRGNSSHSSISDWTDILASQPGCYLRLAMTMDLSLSKGRLPEESDFPESLRGLFTTSFSSVRNLIANGNVTAKAMVTPSPGAAAAATAFCTTTSHPTAAAAAMNASVSVGSDPAHAHSRPHVNHHNNNTSPITLTCVPMPKPHNGNDNDDDGTSTAPRDVVGDFMDGFSVLNDDDEEGEDDGPSASDERLIDYYILDNINHNNNNTHHNHNHNQDQSPETETSGVQLSSGLLRDPMPPFEDQTAPQNAELGGGVDGDDWMETVLWTQDRRDDYDDGDEDTARALLDALRDGGMMQVGGGGLA
ncbi:hypothetical protein F4778DRAFT_735304 [Xylariomycetidae sp. FL2044]|nr:hypothetical protein F4778DRAFT_735304 [Xylariomycetidae sp. FL2044]